MQIAPAPLFRDPIYDGPTDPVIIYNRQEKIGGSYILRAGPMFHAMMSAGFMARIWVLLPVMITERHGFTAAR